jgi:RimJ/RimL family protein N-acetyltransferase
MELRVNDQIRLTEIRPSDKPALLRHFADKEIYNWTLRIPYPYTEAHADAWLTIVAADTRKYGQPVTWAIRRSPSFAGPATDPAIDDRDLLIGVVGLEGIETEPSFRSHRAEIGYWLAKPYWGRGIMTDVVRAVCEHGIREFGLLRITANVFAENVASMRVLEKCGFVCEAPLLKKTYRKDGRFIDGKLYALVR